MSQKRSKGIGKAVDRNYNVTINYDTVVTLFASNGNVLSVTPRQTAWKVARLTVNNPYRQQKPRVLTPTARTLNWYRIDHPVVHLISGPWSAGRIEVTKGTWELPMNTEFNNRYLSPTWTANDEQLRTEAILEALAKVKDQKWNAGVALAESAGVAQMTADLARLVTKTRQAIRNGDVEGAYREFRRKTKYMSYPAWRRKHWDEVRHVRSVRESRQIPTGWTYYHFGIKPTLNDISDAITAHDIARAELAFGRAASVTGYAKHTLKVVNSQNYGIMEHKVLRSVRVKLGVRMSNEVAARASGLGLTNVPEAAWNAAPWSWAVDYFTGFGDWLSALDSSVGWEWDTHWEESFRVVASSEWLPVGATGVKFINPFNLTGRISHKAINRVVRGDLYGPMGSILPRLKRRGPSLQQISTLLSALTSSMRLPMRP